MGGSTAWIGGLGHFIRRFNQAFQVDEFRRLARVWWAGRRVREPRSAGQPGGLGPHG